MKVKNDRLYQDSVKGWATYAKAAGLGAFALGAASSADAAIVHNGGTYNGAAPTFPIVINPPSYTGENVFNFDGAGLDDIALGTGNYGTAFGRDLGLEGGTLGGMIFTSEDIAGTYYTEAFTTGDLIDGTAVQSKVNYGSRTLSAGSFGGSGGYLGFKTSAGYFGWMDLTLSNVDTAGGDTRKIITINGWAIDDSGAAIGAGVPEPNTLALLAAGSVGILARRRRKQAA
jgi:hypothetical protein